MTSFDTSRYHALQAHPGSGRLVAVTAFDSGRYRIGIHGVEIAVLCTACDRPVSTFSDSQSLPDALRNVEWHERSYRRQHDDSPAAPTAIQEGPIDE